MKRRGFLVVSCLVALAVGAGVYWYARNQAGSYRIIRRGGRSFFGNVGVSSGNLFLESGKAGILFGTVAKPGTQEDFPKLERDAQGAPHCIFMVGKF